MSLRLRRAGPADVDDLVAVKAGLRMRADQDGASSRGGFLLGASREQYAGLIAHGHTHLLRDGDRTIGFAAALPDGALRASALWQRRHRIGGADPALLAAVDRLPVGYLDQLALVPDPKYILCGAVLAYHAVAALVADGCALVFTTVVASPVKNLASRPLLAAVGALQVGSLDEDYPDAGPVTSDVFAVTAASLDPGAQDDARRRSRLLRLAELSRQLSGD